MDVDLFVYGVPCGEDFWGKEEDRMYFGTLYDGSSDEVKFLVQIRSLNSHVYCYYNYQVYKNVVGNDGREGSYFGISLRLNAYCKDVMNMYRILDTIYNVYILGSIGLLKTDKTKLKYTVADFLSVSGKLKSLEEVVLQLLQNACSKESFVGLNGFSMGSGNCPTCNLYDCTIDSVLETVRRNGKIAVSPYYPSSKETDMQKQCAAQIQAAQQQYEARLKEDANIRDKEKSKINSSLSSAKAQIVQLQNDVSKKDSRIKELEDSESKLKSELRSIGQTKKIAQIIEPLRKPISDLAVAFQSIPGELKESEHHEHNEMEKVLKLMKDFLPFINFILLVILLLFTFAVPFFQTKKNVSEDKMELKTEIDTLEYESEKLQKEPDDIVIPRIDGDMEMEEATSSPADFNINSVWIDVRDYAGGTLSKSKRYVITAKNGVDEGTWMVKGGELRKTDDPKVIEIAPTDSAVIITYSVDNKIKERKLKAQ